VKFAYPRLWLALPIVMILFSGAVSAQSVSPPGLTPQVEQILEAQGFVVTATAYRQIFEPYLRTDLPVFVTTDSLLQAFHVLLDGTLGRYEKVNAGRFPDALQLLWFRTEASREPLRETGDDSDREAFLQLKQSAWQYARLILAVGLRLAEKEPVGLEPSLVSRVNALVEAVRQAGNPDEYQAGPLAPMGIDPASFQAPAFYRQSQRLQRYYLARRWLQSAPFRTDRDEELMAILLLGKAVATIEEPLQRHGIERFLRCYRELLGDGRKRDLLLAAQIVRDRPGNLNAVRDYLEVIQDPHLQDRGTETPSPKGSAFFIVPPDRLPDAVFIRQVHPPNALDGLPAAGLRFCALLGSDFARKRVDGLDANFTANPFATARRGFGGSYFQSLAALLDAPEPDAPPFLRTEGWKAKNCNTVLSAWVQMRGTQPRQGNYHFEPLGEFYGEMGIAAGFVEPQPDFFARLSDTVEEVYGLFERCESFHEPQRVLAQNLDRFAEWVAAGRHTATSRRIDETDEDRYIAASVRMALAVLEGVDVESPEAAEVDRELEARVRDLAESLRRGDYRDDPAFQALVIELNIDRRLRWQTLLRLCRRLEVMAHKQLRGVAFEERETYMLADYGLRLASIMGYSGTSFRNPLDNAPRVVPGPGTAIRFAIGTGRARELLVRYPFQQRNILCRGAILPFFRSQDDPAMGDRQWQEQLDSDERPRRPDWMEPILAPNLPQKPY